MAQHLVEFDLDRAGEKLVKPPKQGLEMGHLQMGFEVSLARPILVEHEDVRVRRVEMEVVVDASRLGARWLDLCGENCPQLLAGLVFGDDHANDGAMRH